MQNTKCRINPTFRKLKTFMIVNAIGTTAPGCIYVYKLRIRRVLDIFISTYVQVRLPQ